MFKNFLKLKFEVAILALFLNLLCLNFSIAQNLELKLEIDPPTGSMQDTFDFRVKIQGTQSADYPELSASSDFNVELVGPQSSLQIINGKISQEISFHYQLQPKHIGKLTTPAAKIIINGQQLSADPLTVNVLSNSELNNQLQDPQDQAVFLRQSLNIDTEAQNQQIEAFLGQQIIYSLELYMRVSIQNIELSDSTFEGFWNEDFGKQDSYMRNINGVSYKVVRLRKVLYPLKTGEIEIPIREMQVKAIDDKKRRSRSHFDPFFDDSIFNSFFDSSRLKTLNLKSNALKLNIKDLPKPSRNLSTWGMDRVLVGDTTIAISYDADDVDLGESKTIEVSITSEGNLNPIKSIDLNKPDQLKSYAEQPVSNSFESLGKLRNRKSFSISLIAQAPGQIKIPALELSYFDPKTKSYKIAQSNQIEYQVKLSPEQQKNYEKELNQKQSRQEKVELPSQANPSSSPNSTATESLRYESLSKFEKFLNSYSITFIIYCALGITALLLLCLLFLTRAKKAKPFKLLLDRIDQIQDLNQLILIFNEFITLKLLGQKDHSLSSEQIKALIRQNLTSNELKFELQNILDQLDNLKYSGTHVDLAKISEIKKQCIDTLKKMTF